jgi:hypothetical protein
LQEFVKHVAMHLNRHVVHAPVEVKNSMMWAASHQLLVTGGIASADELQEIAVAELVRLLCPPVCDPLLLN